MVAYRRYCMVSDFQKVFANAFNVPENKLAYLEPLCTQPKYRRRGIAAAIIAELIRRTQPLGADHITGGAAEFYTAIGYSDVCNEERWVK